MFGRRGAFSATTSSDFGVVVVVGSRRRGRDIIYDMEVTVEDVLRGKKEEVEVARFDRCKECGGAGPRLGPNHASAQYDGYDKASI